MKNKMKTLIIIQWLYIASVVKASIINQKYLKLATVENAIDGSKNTTEFLDMNSDVQLSIIENLEISELIALAETNKYLAVLATEVFKRRFSSKTIDFNFAGWEDRNPNETFILQKREKLQKLLKHFGHVILKLRIQFPSFQTYTSESIRAIGESINSYCASTLIEFKIVSAYEQNIFRRMSKPFEKVETVSYDTDKLDLINTTLEFDKLFPVVRNLVFETMPKQMANWVFPHLKELYIDLSHYSTRTDNELETMLRNNPQIESLSIAHSERAFLRKINDILPNLRNLQLTYYQDDPMNLDTEPIVFNHITNFTTYFGTESMPDNINFDQLEQFNALSYPIPCNRWVNFVVKCKTLKKLIVYEDYISDNQLDELASADLSLIDVELTLLNVNVDTVVKFVQNSGEIETIKITFHSFDLFASANESLRRQFSNQWDITDFEDTTAFNVKYKGLLLERI